MIPDFDLDLLRTFVAIAVSSNFQTSSEASLAPGDSMTIGDYSLRFEQVEVDREPHRVAQRARVAITEGGRTLGTLTPAITQYPRQREPIGSPAVRTGLTHDLYLTLMNLSPGGGIGLRAILTPAVVWIWIGVLVMVVGTCLCLISPQTAAAPATEARRG